MYLRNPIHLDEPAHLFGPERIKINHFKRIRFVQFMWLELEITKIECDSSKDAQECRMDRH